MKVQYSIVSILLLAGMGVRVAFATDEYCAKDEYNDCVSGCSDGCSSVCGAAQATCEFGCDATYETCDLGCDVVCCLGFCEDDEDCINCRAECSTFKTNCKSGCSVSCTSCISTCGDVCTLSFCDYPPVCDAGGPYFVNCLDSFPATVLDGSQSSDDHGLADEFQVWTTDCTGATLKPTQIFWSQFIVVGECTPDQCTATLHLTDGNHTASCEADVYYLLGDAIYVNWESTADPPDGTIDSPFLVVTDGVDSASDSESTVLFVARGFYDENVFINKDLWITPYGAGSAAIIIGE